MRKYSVEFIGTFFLVFTVGAAVLSSSALAPIGIGAVLMAMIYAGGHISGAHYNPAVTLAVLVRGRIKGADAVAYWIAQFAGGSLGGVIARSVAGTSAHSPVPSAGHRGVAFVAELLFTFALAYVVLQVATSDDHAGNNFYGLAIGFTVAAGAIAVGGISGAAFNPAVVLGGSFVGIFSWSAIWIYLLANLGGGVLAGLVFLAVNPGGRTTAAASHSHPTRSDTMIEASQPID